MKPLLLLDVDGVLNPWEAPEVPAGFEAHTLTPGGIRLRVLLSREHGAWLNDLSDQYDLVWATTWEHYAPTLIAPLIGLPGDVPVIEFDRGNALTHMTWKLPSVQDYVGDRPFAWIDDDLQADAWSWAEEREFPSLLLQPREDIGLTRDHIEELWNFAAVLT